MPTAPTARRPQIKPGLRRVRRDAATVQIGLTPDVGVIVTGLAPGEAELLEQLDGTRSPRDLADWAAGHGLDPGRVPRLVALLDGAGVLTGAPTDRAHLHQLGERRRRRLGPDATAWSIVYADAGDGFGLLAERARHQVLVVGASRLAGAVRAAVDRAGVRTSGRAALGVGVAAHGAAATYGPAAAHGPAATYGPAAAYGLLVLVGEDAPVAADPGPGAAVLAQQPHLAVVAGADRADVGPLVVPGRSACLRCVELHRTDRDPGWPQVLAQLGDRPATARGETSLTELVAALAALQVTCWLDARRTPASVGATLTVTLPDGVSSRRAWSRHPRCGCSWLTASLPADR